MTAPAGLRAAVRLSYGYECGYCGVPEALAGGELEIDHFQPRRHAGTDTPGNLVYACPACNRFKSEYWPAPYAPESLHLLHPKRDDLAHHVVLSANGRLAGLTPRGWFHIRWLHLNRPQVVEMRQHLRETQSLRDALAQAEAARSDLQQQISRLEAEIADLLDLIGRLTGE